MHQRISDWPATRDREAHLAQIFGERLDFFCVGLHLELLRLELAHEALGAVREFFVLRFLVLEDLSRHPRISTRS